MKILNSFVEEDEKLSWEPYIKRRVEVAKSKKKIVCQIAHILYYIMLYYIILAQANIMKGESSELLKITSTCVHYEVRICPLSDLKLSVLGALYVEIYFKNKS